MPDRNSSKATQEYKRTIKNLKEKIKMLEEEPYNWYVPTQEIIQMLMINTLYVHVKVNFEDILKC